MAAERLRADDAKAAVSRIGGHSLPRGREDHKKRPGVAAAPTWDGGGDNSTTLPAVPGCKTRVSPGHCAVLE